FNECMRKFRRQLRDAYRFPGFVPVDQVRGMFGDPRVRVVPLRRRRKKRRVVSARLCAAAFTIGDRGWRAICPAARCESTWSWRYGGWPARSVAGGMAKGWDGWG